MQFYKVLSALLEYPDEELKAALPEIRAALVQVPDISAQDRAALEGFLKWMADTDTTELQAGYVQTFDLTPEHSLHLTHHLFGDDKNRGPALIDLSEFYKSYGVQVASNELPDYLPLILEFAAYLEDSEARTFLADAAKVLTVLAANLEKAGSPYAPLVRAIEARGQMAELAV